MRKLSKIISVLLVVCLIITTAGCSNSKDKSNSGSNQDSKNPKKVTIRFGSNFVGSNPIAKVTENIIKKFQDDYPNVTIAVEGTAGNDHQTKIKLDSTSDRLPDIFDYWRLDPVFGLDVVAQAGQLGDLTSWVKSDPAFKDLFDEYSWNTSTKDGKIYGVPVYMFYIQFLANKEVFDRAGVPIPQNWDGLLKAVKDLKAKGELPWGINIKGDSSASRIYDYVMDRIIGNERALNMHAGKEPINVPEVVKAASLLKELLVGYMPPDANAIDRESVYAKYVNNDKAALIIDGTWNIPTIKPEIQDKMVVLEFPVIPGGAQKETHIERDLSKLYYVSSKAWNDPDKQPYIKELVKRLTSRETGKKYAEEGKQAIPMLGVEVDPKVVGRLAADAQKTSLKLPGDKWLLSVLTPDQRTRFYALFEEFLSNKLSPEKFVEELDKIIRTK